MDAMKHFYAKTRFWQDGEEFVCVVPFACAVALKPTYEEVLLYLTGILKQSNFRFWGKDGVSFKKSSLKFGNATYEEVARQLVNPLNNKPVNGITFDISTRWEELEGGTLDMEYDKYKHQDL